MSSFTKNHPFIYSFYCILCVLPLVISLPVITKDDPFDKFIEFLTNNNCSMPKEVELPFSVTDTVPFSYLSFPLKECRSSEAVKENNEANLLCREVFEVIQNITCTDYKLNSKIESGKLSTEVCQDFAAIQSVIPKQDEFLSRKFADSIICKIMCIGKYEFLCKTLLWGYNTQAKLKNTTLESNVAVKAEENLESHPNSNKISDEETTSNLEKAKQALNRSISVKSAASDTKPKPSTADKAEKNERNLSATEDQKKESQSHQGEAETVSTQIMDSEKTDKSIKASKVIVIPPTTEAVSKSTNDLDEHVQNTKIDEQVQNTKIDEQAQNTKSDEQAQNTKSDEQVQNTKSELHQSVTNEKSNDLGENNIEIPSESSDKNKIDVPAIDLNISASDARGDEDIPIPGEDNEIDVDDKNKEKVKNIPSPTVPKTEEENDLKKPGQENDKQGEAKGTIADLDSKGEDTKENEIPNGESDSNVAEPTVPLIFPDKSEDFEPQPELKDPEQYNDSENDGDYAKQEYDTAFNPALRKESNVKNTVNDGSSQFSSGSNMQISNENFLGHESNINRNFLPARNYLPDQEDSHFFFYFLTIVLVLMAGYLIFHNKQKIIALIVEGRHERRRRSHGAGYKKLETK